MTDPNHLKLQSEYLKDCMKSATPWFGWQFRYKNESVWTDCMGHPEWSDRADYRRKPDPEDEFENALIETFANSIKEDGFTRITMHRGPNYFESLLEDLDEDYAFKQKRTSIIKALRAVNELRADDGKRG